MLKSRHLRGVSSWAPHSHRSRGRIRWRWLPEALEATPASVDKNCLSGYQQNRRSGNGSSEMGLGCLFRTRRKRGLSFCAFCLFLSYLVGIRLQSKTFYLPFSWLARFTLPNTSPTEFQLYYIGFINASAHPLGHLLESQPLARQPVAREVGPSDIPAQGLWGSALLEEYHCVVSV